jgi:hypothetical protein
MGISQFRVRLIPVNAIACPDWMPMQRRNRFQSNLHLDVDSQITLS